MEWQMVVTLVIAVPVMLFPAAFVWYLTIGGIVGAARKTKAVNGGKAVAVKMAA